MTLPPADDEWHEADALFRAALDRPASERAAYLDRHCAHRPSLRRDVESLLEAARAADGWLDRSGAIIRNAASEVLLGRDAGARREDAPDTYEPPGRRIGRYRIVRQIARGGMGTVYLAERADGAFERQVALKLLRRGLDTDDILDRFRRERQILAGLEHPHIARLIDGGATDDGRPYLVMDYVDGASITDYSDRERLDVDARLRLFGTVCEAVGHAHRSGVIHRDLKPANILVDAAGRARLVDFGIAKLLADEPGAVRTSTGRRLMTPDYASPEQARGDGVTAASDVYQLGLLLDELLTGERVHRVSNPTPGEIERIVCAAAAVPPSTRVKRVARTEAGDAIANARSTEPGRLYRRLRGDLDTIVLKALRTEPEGRYATAGEMFEDVRRHLEGLPIKARPPSGAYRMKKFSKRHRGRIVTSAATAVLVLASVLLLPRLRSAPAIDTMAGGVAILPFRTAGADASLGYLREGMVDLLAAELTGEGGPRAIAPATVLKSWAEAGPDAGRDLSTPGALAVARSVGAEWLVTGEVVGSPASMILSASLLDARGGGVRGRATVEGPVDSLPFLVDRLTGRLLLLGAGEDLRLRSTLASVPLPALRAYLEGESAYRHARHDEAYRSFSRAVETDSTFAVAAVRAYRAAWLSGRAGDARLLDVAWRGRASLSELDRAYVTVYLGPQYPGPYAQTSRLAERRRLVELAPDRVDSQYMLGDRILHWGPLLDMQDTKEQAVRRFQHALSLDSAHTPLYRHLVPLLYSIGEPEEATRLARAYLRRQPSGGISQYVTWRMAAAHGDTALLGRVRRGMDTLPDIELLNIFRTSIADTVALEDAGRALSILGERSSSPAVEQGVLRARLIYDLLRGHPAAAVRAAGRLGEAQALDQGYPRLEATSALVTSAMFGDGDAEAGRRARAALAASVFTADGSIAPAARAGDLCTVLHAAAWEGTTLDLDRALDHLRAYDRTGPAKDTGVVCALLVDAVVATLADRPDASAALSRLDSALATGPQVLVPDLWVPATLATAQLHERQGNAAAALAAVRRRIYNFDSTNFLLAAGLRQEGRLAALTGDLDGAEAAYRYYLALRSDPEPGLRAQADSVRAELAAVRARGP